MLAMKAKTGKSDKQRILVSLPRSLWRQFRISALEQDLTAGALLQRLIEGYLQVQPEPPAKKKKDEPQEKIFG